jgi:hypothetical protein
MERDRVTSSTIASIGYDQATQVLEIEFRGGGIYQYSNVPQSVYSGLMSASSHGGYLDRVIKKGGYRYRRIR